MQHAILTRFYASEAVDTTKTKAEIDKILTEHVLAESDFTALCVKLKEIYQVLSPSISSSLTHQQQPPPLLVDGDDFTACPWLFTAHPLMSSLPTPARVIGGDEFTARPYLGAPFH